MVGGEREGENQDAQPQVLVLGFSGTLIRRLGRRCISLFEGKKEKHTGGRGEGAYKHIKISI